jgi:hypothetical protein
MRQSVAAANQIAMVKDLPSGKTSALLPVAAQRFEDLCRVLLERLSRTIVLLLRGYDRLRVHLFLEAPRLYVVFES